jgi:uncharacterized protein (DUF58 family)
MVSFAIGWLLGWPELAVPGGAILGLFAAGSVASLGRPKLTVTLRAQRRRVAVGGQAGVSLVIANTGGRRAGPSSLTVPVQLRGTAQVGEGRGSERCAPVRLRALAAGQTAVTDAAIAARRRGLLRIGPVRALRGDPFGLVARVFDWGSALEIAVYPPWVHLPAGLTGQFKDLEGKPIGQTAEPDVTFHCLNPYQEGDDIRAIHWRSSARLGRPMVRQSEDTRRGRLALVVSTGALDYGGEEDFELAVAVYASIGLARLRQAGELAVFAGAERRRFGRDDAGRLLDQAAGIVLAGGQGLSAAAAAAEVRRALPGVTSVVLVTGGRPTASELTVMAAGLPGQASLVALCCQVVASAKAQAGVSPEDHCGGRQTLGRAGRLRLVGVSQLSQLPGLASLWERV